MSVDQGASSILESTPDVSRNGFSYSQGRFLAVGEFYRDIRLDSRQLYMLLTSTVPRGSDKSAGFYAAQLAHYGLKPLKTKDAAKKRLLAAFGEGTALIAPQIILDLEVAMRNEWETAEQQRLGIAAARPKSRAKQTARKTTFPKPKPSAQLVPENKPNIKMQAVSPEQQEKFKQTRPAPQGKQKIKDSTVLKGQQPGVEQIRPTHTPKGTLQEHIKGLSRSAAQDLLLKILETASGEKAISKLLPVRGKEGESSKQAGTKLTVEDWAGSYTVKSKELAENWSEAQGPLQFEAFPSSTSAHLWASFHFGIVSGVMRSVRQPPTKLGEKIFFRWRGHEEGEGEMTFDEDNDGFLLFHADGRVEGDMRGDCFGNFTFSGKADSKCPSPSNSKRLKVVAGIKRKWRSINPHNGEVARVSRWGRWGGEERQEAACASDTTVGHSDDDYGDDAYPDDGYRKRL